jgi:hypothetical protein
VLRNINSQGISGFQSMLSCNSSTEIQALQLKQGNSCNARQAIQFKHRNLSKAIPAIHGK